VLTADLNGDEIPDLIVADGGGNRVLVYPGLPGGGFGTALNSGNGFATGTNPVSVTFADVNGDGRPDLVVADQGSNDVSILMNEGLPGGDFTFTRGPRLRVGVGPVSTVVQDVNGDGIPDLVVSDAGSNDLTVVPGRGGGFFDDQHTIVTHLAESPGPIFAGEFGTEPGPDFVTLNPGTDHVTMISRLGTNQPETRTFPAGGFDPVAAVAVRDPRGFLDLVVADRGDGHFSLLEGGPDGLSVAAVLQPAGLPSPTALALGTLNNDSLEVYAATAGEESASLLVFFLGGTGLLSPPGSPGSSGALGPPAAVTVTLLTGGASGLTLLPARDSALPLIATLLIPLGEPDVGQGESIGSQGGALQAIAPTAVTTSSFGQGLTAAASRRDDDIDDNPELVAEFEAAVLQGIDNVRGGLSWSRIVLGLDEAFEQFRERTRANPLFDAVGAGQEGPPVPSPAPEAGGDSRATDRSGHLSIPARTVDAAIEALAVEDNVVIPTARRESLVAPDFARPIPIPRLMASVGLAALFGGVVLSVRNRRILASHPWGVLRNGRTGVPKRREAGPPRRG
jgi:hypothetical protein